jgi:hypothetical protein
MSAIIKTGLSNAHLIGEIFGTALLRLYHWLVKWELLLLLSILDLGIVLTTAAHGTSRLAMFWMMIGARGVARFGVGGDIAIDEPYLNCS